MRLNPKVEISEDGFLFNTENGDNFLLNSTAIEIINLIKNRKEYDEIKKHFLENYEIKETDFDRYFFEFLDDLKKHNILIY